MTTLSPIDAANLLAGQAVAAATALLDGRHSYATSLTEADRLQASLLAIDDVGTHQILQPVRLLVIALRGTALAARAEEAPGASLLSEARRDRWEHVTASLVEMVRVESLALRAHAPQQGSAA